VLQASRRQLSRRRCSISMDFAVWVRQRVGFPESTRRRKMQIKTTAQHEQPILLCCQRKRPPREGGGRRGRRRRRMRKERKQEEEEEDRGFPQSRDSPSVVVWRRDGMGRCCSDHPHAWCFWQLCPISVRRACRGRSLHVTLHLGSLPPPTPREALTSFSLVSNPIETSAGAAIPQRR
jgi:hypothetical protein